MDSNYDDQGYLSIALDSNDYPHISYSDYGSTGVLKYAIWNGNTWFTEIIDMNDEYYELFTSLALDSDDNPHISYNGEGLDYIKLNGTVWEIEIVDPDGGVFSSIALDSSDNPHISYTTGGKLKYARWNGNSWDIETVDDGGGSHSLVLDKNDYPHISYRGGGANKYTSWNGDSWENETIEKGGGHTSMALDSNDRPHISYVVERDIKMARWTGKKWVIDTVDSIDIGHYDGWTSIALDSKDRAHISYIGGCALKFAREVDGSWITEHVYHVGHGTSTSIAIDKNDHAFISNYAVLDRTRLVGDVVCIKFIDYDSDGDGVSDRSDFLPYFNNHLFFFSIPLTVTIILGLTYIWITIIDKKKAKTENQGVVPVSESKIE